MTDIFAASHLVLGRSGAGLVTELAALGKPSILIPLPGSGGNEQQQNAAVLGNLGAALVLEQNDATPERLLQEVDRLMQSPAALEAMGQKARQAASPDAAERLADLILELAAETQRSRQS